MIFSTKFCTECVPCTENTVLKTDTGWTIFNVNHVHRHKRCLQHSVNVYRISPSQAPSCLSQNHPPQVPLKLLSYSGSKKVKKKKKHENGTYLLSLVHRMCISMSIAFKMYWPHHSEQISSQNPFFSLLESKPININSVNGIMLGRLVDRQDGLSS